MGLLTTFYEDIHFEGIGGPVVGVTTGATFDSVRHRTAVRAPGTPYLRTQLVSSLDCWVALVLYGTNFAASGQIDLFDTGYSTTQPVVQILLSANSWSLRRWDGASWVSSSFSFALATSVLNRLDVRLKLADSDGAVGVWVNGVEAVLVTGDTLLVGTTGLNRLEIRGGGGAGAGANWYISGGFQHTDDTRAKQLITLAPNGAGDLNEWDSGDYTSIDEPVLNDGDLTASTTAGQRALYATADPSGTLANLEVECVEVSSRSRRGVTGPQSLRHLVSVSSAIASGSDVTLFEPYSCVRHQFTVNPNTTGPWSLSALDDVQIGQESRA